PVPTRRSSDLVTPGLSVAGVTVDRMTDDGDVTDPTGTDWDELAPTFDDEPDHGLRDPAVRAAWAARLRAWLPARPGDVLDLGCGTGSLSLLAAEQGDRSGPVPGDGGPGQGETGRTRRGVPPGRRGGPAGRGAALRRGPGPPRAVDAAGTWQGPAALAGTAAPRRPAGPRRGRLGHGRPVRHTRRPAHRAPRPAHRPGPPGATVGRPGPVGQGGGRRALRGHRPGGLTAPAAPAAPGAGTAAVRRHASRPAKPSARRASDSSSSSARVAA